MPGLVGSATAVMSRAQQRLEIAASNIANVSTPGYKRVRWYSNDKNDIVSFDGIASQIRVRIDQGKLQQSGRPLDLAISGEGLFQVRDGARLLFTRQGQFSRISDGSIVTPQGFVLQQAGGGDLLLDRADVEILPDGTVLDGDRPVARVGIFNASIPQAIVPIQGSLFSIAPQNVEEVAEPQVRQGMLEASNVSSGDEMITMMASIRDAETGAKLIQTYDDLMGRAITTFGQTGR